MDVKYFKSQIVDELEGALNYIRKAIEMRLSYPAWSKMFAQMSEAEVDHSSKLYDMFEEYCRHVTEKNGGDTPSYLRSVHHELMDEYSEMMTKIHRLHEMYKDKQKEHSSEQSK